MLIYKYLDPKNDLAFKKIFGEEKHKRITISFLNAVCHLEGDAKIADLIFLHLKQTPEIDARKESIIDVLVRDEKGARYIIEMQVAKVKGFEKRAQYYAAKTYISHLGPGEGYENLKKVIFLAITSYTLFPNKEGYKSDHEILDANTHECDLKDFSFIFVELPKFNKKEGELFTLEDKWYYFLKHAEGGEDISEILADPDIREAHKVLESYYWTEEQLWEYQQVSLASHDARNALAAALEDGLAKGIEKGLARGKEEGLAEGMEKGLAEGMEKGLAEGTEKGRFEGTKSIVLNMLRQNMPLEDICSITGLELDEVLAIELESQNRRAPR